MYQNTLEAVGTSGGGRVRREVFAANKLRRFNTRGIEAGGRWGRRSMGLGRRDILSDTGNNKVRGAEQENWL